MPLDHLSHAQLTLDAFALGLDQSGTPIILLTGSGHLQHVGPAAAEVIRRSPILQVRDGRLYMRRTEDRRALKAGLDAAIQATDPDSAEPNLVILRNREARPVMALLLSRIAVQDLPPVISVRIADLLSPSSAPPQWLARIFGFTPAEARVASALLDGLDLRAIAEREAVALETIRGHVKRAMAKTTARSQAQFVRLMLLSFHALCLPR